MLRATLIGAAALGCVPAHAADTATPPIISAPSESGWFGNARSGTLAQIGTLPNKLALTIAAQTGTMASFAPSYDAWGKGFEPSRRLADLADGNVARFSLSPKALQRPSWFSLTVPAFTPRFDPAGPVSAAPTVIDLPAVSSAVNAEPASLPAPVRYTPTIGNAPDLFGSEAIRIGKTALDAKWRTVADVRLGKGPWTSLVAHASGGALQELAVVNRWVNHEVRFADDAYGDRWSNAAQTLRQHQGDCEDYAIAKMQILRAMGFAENDLYLVIARDLVRHADHALLAVKVNDRFVVLDSGTDSLLDGTVPQDYRPIFTFSGNRTWIHGYKAPPTVIALAAVQPIGRAN